MDHAWLDLTFPPWPAAGRGDHDRATYTSRYLDNHPGAGASSAGLVHGFEIAFYALAAVAAAGAVLSALLVQSKSATETTEAVPTTGA